MSTYRAELVEGAEDLYDEVNGLAVDGGVDDVQELRRLSHDVERLDVVRLFPQVVLQVTQTTVRYPTFKFNPFTAMMSLEKTNKTVKFQILKHFCFLFRITRERVCIETHRTESRFVIGPGKYTLCRRVCALFNPEILQAWAAKGLMDRKKSILRLQSNQICPKCPKNPAEARNHYSCSLTPLFKYYRST